MSGGSYNYLYCHVGGLEAQRGDIEAMRDRLIGLAKEGIPGAARASRQTRKILRHFDAAEKQAQELSAVWHAVEWWDSCDYGEDEVQHVLAQYAGEQKPAKPDAST